MILYRNDIQDRSWFEHRPAVAGPPSSAGPLAARRGGADRRVGGRPGSTLRQGGMPMRQRRAPRALHLRGAAPRRGAAPAPCTCRRRRPTRCVRGRRCRPGCATRWRRSRRSTSSCCREERWAEWPWSPRPWRWWRTWPRRRWRATMRGAEKITAGHRERTAIVYIRQSSLAQVRDNTESTARQYALADEAVRLGWARQAVEVIDADLGSVGPLGGPPPGVQGPGRAGVCGRGRRHLRARGVPPGPLLGGPVAPVGAGPPDRHPGHRRRRHLRPGELQRPPPARA